MKIKKILIANRGEIAVRILKSCRKLDISGVVVFHAADADSPAVKMADETVELFGDTPVAAYLNIEAIVEACKTSGADAVHPGFGFLAENGAFARRLAEENIKFIGPNPEVIDLMGNKISARSFAIEHNIPIVPSVTQEKDTAEFITAATSIGFPLLLKAAAGGGGKGMTIVHEASELASAIQLTSQEAVRAFGDGALYAERYVEKPRHIEVQILADEHGHVIHLGERECSIQRRFQKVIEEAPSAALTPELRADICNTAVSIAQKAGYQNAGTVEMILAQDSSFYFLEMNTRLQVEHPVTEMVTGVDLVAEQINVANGKKLPFTQTDIKFNGHAIECRIYAEDPEDDFAPTTGPILLYQEPSGDNVRVDSGFIEGMRVTSAFDPMLAKLIVHGQDRMVAIKGTEKALREYILLGLKSNLDWLQSVMQEADFQAGEFHTGYIAEKAEHLGLPPLTSEQKLMVASVVALQERPLTSAEYLPQSMHKSMGGWQN
ncbi:MAG: biotin carboxylase N-terminal domain-containing protein [Chloroflexota bacterium]